MLSEKKKRLLAEFVDFKCEQCGKHEDEVGKLHPHRLRRAWQGGTYEHRNVKMVCTECHGLYHGNEFPNKVRSK
jgi:hypothetical protein